MIRLPPCFILPGTLLSSSTLFLSAVVLLLARALSRPDALMADREKFSVLGFRRDSRVSDRLGPVLVRQPVTRAGNAARSRETSWSAGFLRPARARLARRCGTLAASRSEEHTSELQSLMRISYAVFCLNKKN